LVEMAGVGGVSHLSGRRYLGEWEAVAAFLPAMREFQFQRAG
jgi:hypothetical protein